MSTCKACGAPILWVRTRAGRSMPCDTRAIPYRAGGELKLVTPAGDVVSAEAVENPAEADGWGYAPHWATCQAPKTFRKRGSGRRKRVTV